MNNPFAFGAALGGMINGVNLRDLGCEVKVAAVLSEYSPEAEKFERTVCGVAADILDWAGHSTSVAARVYHRAKSASAWPQEFRELADLAMTHLGRVCFEGEAIKTAAHEDCEVGPEDVVKMASRLVPAALNQAAALTPEVVRALVGVSALGGGLAGVLGWKLNRAATEDDDADMAAMKLREAKYRQFAEDLKASIDRRVG